MGTPKQAAKVVPPQWKIPPVRVESDDCTVYVDTVIEDGEIIDKGTPYQVHVGEWVEVFPARSLAEQVAMGDISATSTDSLRLLCGELSKRIYDWDWTGNDKQPLPKPYNSPETLMALTDDELVWLMSAAKGRETKADRKNA